MARAAPGTGARRDDCTARPRSAAVDGGLARDRLSCGPMLAFIAPRPHRVARVAAAAGLAMLAAACQTSREPDLPAAAPARAPGVEAPLTPIGGSAAQGSAKFVDRGDGTLNALVVINNVVPGTYRVAIHERGNCSSPNGFSAGKPWAPPGSGVAATELLPTIAIGPNGNGQMSTRLRGVALRGPDSLEGRAILVHQGATVDADIVPDRPNRAVMCGAVGPVRSMLDTFRNAP